MKIVEIKWVDSCSYAEVWVNKEHVSEVPFSPSDCATVGYLIQEDEDCITIAQSINDNQYGKLFTIPRGCIEEINELDYGDQLYDAALARVKNLT